MLDSKQVQTILKSLGYYKGAVNGDLRNEGFRDSLKKYQAAKGLTVDGWFGNECNSSLTKFLYLPEKVKLEDLRPWRLTHYYIASESDYGWSFSKVPVLDVNGKVLAKVSPTMFANMSLEGTGKLSDGRLLNVTGKWATPTADYSSVVKVAEKYGWLANKHAGYAGLQLNSTNQVTKVMAFKEVPKSELGTGWGQDNGIARDPFKTVAADLGRYKTSDPRFIGKGGLVPVGTQVLIVDLIGKKMPDGSQHSGWLQANDTGSAIFGAHFDLFSGNKQLAKEDHTPSLGHIWFEGITGRVPTDYSYGLVK